MLIVGWPTLSSNSTRHMRLPLLEPGCIDTMRCVLQVKKLPCLCLHASPTKFIHPVAYCLPKMTAWPCAVVLSTRGSGASSTPVNASVSHALPRGKQNAMHKSKKKQTRFLFCLRNRSEFFGVCCHFFLSTFLPILLFTMQNWIYCENINTWHWI